MCTGEVPQNIYDDPEFFAGYSGMERFGAGWDRAMEQPYFMDLLPPVDGLRVLDMGCGAGQLAKRIAELGASEVTATDISERMLAVARSEWAHPRVTHVQRAMEDMDFQPGRFDLIVSSLALHYVEDYRTLMRRVSDWLAPGGTLVFSTEHPIFTARAGHTGWATGSGGAVQGWTIDSYSDEGLREHRWFVDGVKRYHRTVSTLLNGLLDVGLLIERVVEPVPGGEWLRQRPDMVDERRRPIFLLVKAHKSN